MRLYTHTHTHTHTHTRDLLTNEKNKNNNDNIKFNKKVNKIKNRKWAGKRKSGEPIVIRLNLSFTIIKTILIVAIISLITLQATLTIIKTQKQKDLLANQEEKTKVTYVASKKIDENREEILDDEKNPIEDTRAVPIPAGYTASQVPGERSIDTGFVIYEGDINWSEYINKDDIYNKDPNIGVEKPLKIKNTEETSMNQWILLEDGIYSSGYVDEAGIQYGNYHKDNKENKLSSKEFTLTQSETLIIKWAVSSEVEDKLYYTIKNTETGELIGGEKTGISGTDAGTKINELKYTDTEVELEKGKYEIEFTYKKNSSNSEGLDAGFVKSIERKIPDDEVPKVVFTIPEGDGATENNHHWLQYEDGTYVSGYVDEAGKTYGNYHVPNSENVLTSEEFTIERESILHFEFAESAEVIAYNTYGEFIDYVYYFITDKTTGEEVFRRDRIIEYTWFGDNYENLDFELENLKLNQGTYTISFVYKKNGSYDEYLDAGFIRNVRLEANKDNHIDIDFNKGICQGGEYEENIWSTGYVKEENAYGNYRINKSISTLETEEITVVGGVALKFEWSVSSKANDNFYYEIVNTETNAVIGGMSTKISGTTRGTEYSGLTYEEKTIYLNSGTYKVKYIYEKDNAGHEGLDAGFVKNIRTVQTFTQTEMNIFNLQKSTNQYVWVPISEYELEEIYGVDSNGKLWGKLYENNYNPTTTHSESGLNWIVTDGVMDITIPVTSREPDVTRYIPDYESEKDYRYDLDSQLPKELTGQTAYKLLSKELEQDFYKTIESIKKYGGFYIGRYETGYTGNIRKMDYNSNRNSWYQLYKKCSLLKGENENVRTDMIWGSLWDATLRWFIASGERASNGEKITNDYLINENYAKYLGNYKYSEFNYIKTGANEPLYDQKKVFRNEVIVATGSTEYSNINNIYDMGGNLYEATLESSGNNARVVRDSTFNEYISYRNGTLLSSSYNITARAVLYIE